MSFNNANNPYQSNNEIGGYAKKSFSVSDSKRISLDNAPAYVDFADILNKLKIIEVEGRFLIYIIKDSEIWYSNYQKGKDLDFKRTNDINKVIGFL